MGPLANARSPVTCLISALLSWINHGHPTVGVPYSSLGTGPMVELLTLLNANDLDVYICSGGGSDFVLVISDETYGTPRQAFVGSATTLEYRNGAMYRTKGVEQPIDNGPGKPMHSWTRTGRKPLLAVGVAAGDIRMLETARFALLFACGYLEYHAGGAGSSRRHAGGGRYAIKVINGTQPSVLTYTVMYRVGMARHPYLDLRHRSWVLRPRS